MFESLNSLSISKSCLLDFHLICTTYMSTSLALRTSSYSKENTLYNFECGCINIAALAGYDIVVSENALECQHDYMNK